MSAYFMSFLLLVLLLLLCEGKHGPSHTEDIFGNWLEAREFIFFLHWQLPEEGGAHHIFDKHTNTLSTQIHASVVIALTYYLQDSYQETAQRFTSNFSLLVCSRNNILVPLNPNI